jgi:lipopolysaccharide/colanic/teichoic acid biosynthesis glycosyltransferase
MDMVWGIPLVRMQRAAFRSLAWRLKRLFDLVVGLTALVLLSPVLAACALAVRMEVGAGILFRQERVGLDGRPFTLLKFTSLKPADDNEAATRWSVAHDDRMGRVGRFLRRTSLDELPQLVNIVRGDMSLVGPRPERPVFVEEFTRRLPRYTARHRVPAGLTGAAQVNGLRGDTSIADRARFDNAYIENWSLWGDCKIMLRTAGQVLRAAGR